MWFVFLQRPHAGLRHGSWHHAPAHCPPQVRMLHGFMERHGVHVRAFTAPATDAGCDGAVLAVTLRSSTCCHGRCCRDHSFLLGWVYCTVSSNLGIPWLYWIQSTNVRFKIRWTYLIYPAMSFFLFSVMVVINQDQWLACTHTFPFIPS